LRDHSDELRALIRRVVEESSLPQAQLARDAKLSYATLHSWILGSRTPRPESLVQLAEGLEARAEQFNQLAQELRRAAADLGR
jgi:transcriptional regulator with XRE-family HTH domain